MPTVRLYPLKFRPILRRLVWGGRRLGTALGKPIGPEGDYAESWELSDYKDQVSRVAEGPLAGQSLRDLVRERPVELLGPSLGVLRAFPLLVKFIDARQTLSVQVHPDDKLGATLAGDSGKTEAWIVIDAEPGSVIYSGLKAGVTSDQLASAIAAGRLEPLLHRFEPKPRDCVMVEAGTVHAIGAGVLLAEIQQTSDATFRLFDWGRTGDDGKPRELHVEESLKSTDYTRGPVNPLTPIAEPTTTGNRRERVARCRYFAIDRLTLDGPEPVGRADRFTIVMSLGGSIVIDGGGLKTRLGFGETALLPAELGPCRVIPDGTATVLTCEVP